MMSNISFLRLELNIDNENVTQGLSPHISPMDQNLNGTKFQGCITNLYARFGLIRNLFNGTAVIILMMYVLLPYNDSNLCFIKISN